MGRKNSRHKISNIKNIKTAAFILIIGLFIIGLLSIKNQRDAESKEFLIREDKGESRTVKLVAESEFGKEDIEIELLSRTVSEDEIEKIKEDFLYELRLNILAGNESFDKISDNINLPETIEGYPFDISYRIRPRGLIGGDGKITEFPEEETDFEMEITYSADDFEEKETIEGVIMPLQLNDKEAFAGKIRKYIEAENENDRNNRILTLPEKIDGVDIKWSKKKNSKIPSVAALTVIIAVIMLFKDRLTEGEKKKRRREKIILEYPDFAVKYALLNEAGLTHRQVVERLGRDYLKNKKNSPIYEEVYKAGIEVKGGLPLTDALDRMAKNCEVREINYFVGLINRNIKKGGSNIAFEIRKAADESSSEKREKIRRKAETAGTRLLIPMVLLLIMVFALIMIPAFDSFSF